MLLAQVNESCLEGIKRDIHLYCDEKITSSIVSAQDQTMVGIGRQCLDWVNKREGAEIDQWGYESAASSVIVAGSLNKSDRLLGRSTIQTGLLKALQLTKEASWAALGDESLRRSPRFSFAFFLRHEPTASPPPPSHSDAMSRKQKSVFE
jgi:hypothetical protein